MKIVIQRQNSTLKFPNYEATQIFHSQFRICYWQKIFLKRIFLKSRLVLIESNDEGNTRKHNEYVYHGRKTANSTPFQPHCGPVTLVHVHGIINIVSEEPEDLCNANTRL